MSVVQKVGASLRNGPRRRVSLRRDDDDFVVIFQPEDIVVFRHHEVGALRKVCRSLRWEIVSDTVSVAETAEAAEAAEQT